MHPDDFGMIERGDMFASRRNANPILKTMAPVLFKLGKSTRVTPDLKLTEEFDLSIYGFEARVISLPGQSRGSIDLLTSAGERYPAYLAPVFKLFTKTPLATSYWDSQLKKNGVYNQRFARPYAD